MKYDTFLLDADQTIFDFNLSEKTAINDVFTENKLQFSEEIYNSYHNINLELWRKYEKGEIQRQGIFSSRFKMLFEKYNINCSVDFNISYFEKLAKNAFLLDGAENFLKTLTKSGKVYLATNGRESIQNSRIKLSGIDKYLSGVFISEKIGYKKPQREFFEYIEKYIKDFNKQRTVMIGDSLGSDILGGINFGIDTIWLNFDNLLNREIKPKYTASSYEDILKIIQ